MTLKEIEDKVLNGTEIDRSEAEYLSRFGNLDELCDSADRVCRHFCGTDVDSCSIVNARSGLCGEDCKWCAQSVHYSTGCHRYDFLPDEETLKAAKLNESEGIKRFSLVTSGKRVPKKDLPRYCKTIKMLSDKTNLGLCASMGLLDIDDMQMLRAAGVTRYHCNMETSSKHFKTLCSSHSPEDKHATIRAAKEAGLSVCSGGIIGMGESMDDRIDFAFELRALGVDSVPLNILNPIAGTPLEKTELISEEEVIRTGALFRFVLPRIPIRFAGGRGRLSRQSMLRMLRGGINGVLMGDMLTTISHTIAEDRKLFEEAGLNF